MIKKVCTYITVRLFASLERGKRGLEKKGRNKIQTMKSFGKGGVYVA
jgi:hypothetical protein